MSTTRTLGALAILWALAVAAPLRAEVNEAQLRTRLLHSTALVIAGDLSGTGFVVDRDRNLMVTNYHVVEEKQTVRVVFPHYRKDKLIDDRSFYFQNARDFGIVAQVLKRDAKHDLAVLQVERLPRGIQALTPAAGTLAGGETIFRLGSAAAIGETWKLTGAAVVTVGPRCLNYDSNKQKVEAVMITNDGPNRPGDSGGPVVNEKGELVGVHAAFANREEKSCAIAVRELREFLRDTVSTKQQAADEL